MQFYIPKNACLSTSNCENIYESNCLLTLPVCSLLQIQSNAFTVLFDEHFSVPVEAAAVDEYSLRFSAFGMDLDERNISAGQAELKLSDLDLSIRPFDAWLYLQDINKVLIHQRKPDTHQHSSSLSKVFT